MDATPTIYNRAVNCGRGRVLSVSTYDSGGAAITVDVTAMHSDADEPSSDPVYLEDEGKRTVELSVACRSTRDLHAFTESGAPVIYRILAHHPGDETTSASVKDLRLRSGTESALRVDEPIVRDG